MQKSSAIQLKLSSFKFWKHCSNRVNSEIINQIIMELVVIEKNAYLQLKLQIESLSAQIEYMVLVTEKGVEVLTK